MSAELYERSLTPGNARTTQSYDIGKLFYVAFFGGVIALTAIAQRNGRWLQVKPQVLNMLLVLSILVFAGKATFFYLYSHDFVSMERSLLKFTLRGADIALYAVYFAAFKKSYRQFEVLDGEVRPLFKDGLLWCLLGGIIEVAFWVAVTIL